MWRVRSIYSVAAQLAKVPCSATGICIQSVYLPIIKQALLSLQLDAVVWNVGNKSYIYILLFRLPWQEHNARSHNARPRWNVWLLVRSFLSIFLFYTWVIFYITALYSIQKRINNLSINNVYKHANIKKI